MLIYFGLFFESQVDEDRVLLFLSKKQNKSWYPELDNGLETAEEEEEEGNQSDGNQQGQQEGNQQEEK
jgi:hypothetical protein